MSLDLDPPKPVFHARGKHMSSSVDSNARDELRNGLQKDMGRLHGRSGTAIHQRLVRRRNCKGCQP